MKGKDTKKHFISNLTIEAVGLVKRGANQKTFYARKSDEIEEADDNLKGETMSDNDNPEPVVSEIDTLFKENPTAFERLKAFLTGTPEEAPVETETPEIVKSDPEPVTPQEDPRIVALEKAQKDTEVKLRKALGDLAEEQDKREHLEYIEKAKAYASVPGKTGELASFLRFIAKSDDEEGKMVIWFGSFLKSVDATLHEAGFYKEFGSEQEADQNVSVLSKAQELTKDGKLSLREALLQSNPDEAWKYIEARQSDTVARR